MLHYRTKGTCSTQIDLDIRDGIIVSCSFSNGCEGNAAGLSRMVVGCRADEVKEKLRGIPCRGSTSCPDQLVKAIEFFEREVK